MRNDRRHLSPDMIRLWNCYVYGGKEGRPSDVSPGRWSGIVRFLNNEMK